MLHLVFQFPLRSGIEVGGVDLYKAVDELKILTKVGKFVDRMASAEEEKGKLSAAVASGP